VELREQSDGVSALHGELTIFEVVALKELLRAAIARGPMRIALDTVFVLDGAGAQLLIAARRTGRVSFVAAPGAIRTQLETTGLAPHLLEAEEPSR
jgi:anti-anti-sigma regulatory factor